MAYAGDQSLTRINRSSLHVAHQIGKMSLYHNGTSFIAKQNGVKTEIGSESLDGALRHVNATNLGAFLRSGRIQVTKTDDGTLMLRHHVNGLGGGPVCGAIAYWGVKVLAYSGLVAGTTTAVVVTGGGAAAAVGGAMVNGGVACLAVAEAGTALAALGTAGGAGVAALSAGGAAATALGGSVAAGTVGLSTVTAVTTAGGMTGLVASIEVAATTLGTMASLCPFLP